MLAKTDVVQTTSGLFSKANVVIGNSEDNINSAENAKMRLRIGFCFAEHVNKYYSLKTMVILKAKLITP